MQEQEETKNDFSLLDCHKENPTQEIKRLVKATRVLSLILQ